MHLHIYFCYDNNITGLAHYNLKKKKKKKKKKKIYIYIYILK